MRCKGRILKPSLSSLGYWTVGLQKDRNGMKTTYIHRLIAMAFIPNPEQKPNVNHKDGNRANKDINNLEWCTQKENVRHAIDVLGVKYGRKRIRF